MHINTSRTQKGPDYVTLCAFDFKREVRSRTAASNLKGDDKSGFSPSFNRARATRDADMNVVTMR